MMTAEKCQSIGLIALAPTHALMFDVPVVLLTSDGAVARVPAAVIHRLLFTIVTLINGKE